MKRTKYDIGLPYSDFSIIFLCSSTIEAKNCEIRSLASDKNNENIGTLRRNFDQRLRKNGVYRKSGVIELLIVAFRS